MGSLMIDGWEGGGMENALVSGFSTRIVDASEVTLPGPWSHSCLYIGSSGGYQRLWEGGSDDEFYFHVRFYLDSGSAWMDFQSPNNVDQFTVYFLNAGYIYLKVGGSGGTNQANGSHVLTTGRWYDVQGYAKVGDSGTGAFQLKLDGVDDIHSGGGPITTGIDTKGDGSSSLVDRNGFGRSGGVKFDDLIVWTTDMGWIGQKGVSGLHPNDEGDTQNWIPMTQTAQDSWDTEVGTNGTAPYAWYKLDETSGTTADNAEGTAARDGTYEGTYTLGTASGRDPIRAGDKYLALTGAGDVALPSGLFDQASATSEMTFELWARVNAGSGNTDQPMMRARKASSTTPRRALGLFQQSDGQGLGLYFGWGDNSGGASSTRPLFTSTNDFLHAAHDVRGCGHWHHYVATIDSSKNVRLYFDGVQVRATTHTMTNPTTGMDRCHIGRDQSDGNYFNGDISEAVYYQAALSATEVAAHYAAGAYHWEQVDLDMRLFPVGQGTYWYDDAGYLWTDTDNDVELFHLSNLISGYDANWGMAVKAIVKKLEAGDRTAALVVKSGTTTDVGSALGFSTGWTRVTRYGLEDDPDTAAAWTNSGVNGVQVGVKAL